MATTSRNSSTEERALTLLGQGVPPSAVANALGVDISRISQLLGQDDFAAKVVEKKFESLSKNNERDVQIDSLEDALLKKLENCLPFMTRPMEILKAFTVLNSAKRRGHFVQEDLTQKQNIIQLNIPQVIVNKFQTNINNQVIKVGQQTLVTIPSNQMFKQLEKASALKLSNNPTETINDITTVGAKAETIGIEQSSGT